MNTVLNELQSSLTSSNGEQRKKWAITIVDENVPLKELYGLLQSDEKTVMRFLWLISDVGLRKPEKLHAELPALFAFMEENTPQLLSSFASWWHYACPTDSSGRMGVPEENEAKAIDLLFRWFLSGDTKVYIKTRALWVLVKLSEKYPDLKQELKMCLADQMDKYTKEFKKRAEKILAEMER